jgi:transcriptional regulator with XRE-family HTH domain
MNTINTATGKVITSYMKASKLSNSAMQYGLHLSRQQLWKYLTGRTSMNLDLMMRACKVLNVKPETFMEAVFNEYRKEKG